MSVVSVQKQLDRYNTECKIRFGGRQKRKAILVSDSKCRRQQDMVEEGEDLFTLIHQGSARSNNSHLIRRVLETIKGLHEPNVMIRLGTCDLTQKLDGAYISFNSVVVKDMHL